MKVSRSISTPARENATWDERWADLPASLVSCWERGRELGQRDPALAERALRGELPVLAWRGGVDRALKKKQKYGALHYLAQWQGIRGEDLSVDTDEEVTLTCTATGMTVVFTSDQALYSEP